MKKFGALILTVLILAFSLTGCSPKFWDESELLNIENPTGTITVGIFEYGDDEPAVSATFTFELYYRDAPNTVANFINLVENGYYKDKVFEQASGNEPFVEFGKKEFIDGETKNKDGEAYDEPLYTKRVVDPAYYIIGEFFNNGYYFGSKEDNDPRNTKKAKIGSMLMIRDENPDDPMSKYNTAYAAFKIQTEVNATKRKPYEELYCVFGQITLSEADLKGQLVGNFFEKSGYSDVYTKEEHCKFKIMNVSINYPQGVTKDDFKVRTIRV